VGTLFHLFSVDADSFNIFTFCSVTGVILWLFAIAGVVPTRPKRGVVCRTMNCVLDLAVHCSYIACISFDIVKSINVDPHLRSEKNRLP